MKRAAIYMRVSSAKQVAEGESIPAQREALLAYVRERSDLTLAGEYLDDGISGQKYEKRDELQRLLGDVKCGKIDIILFTKLDRWFRSVRHYLTTQEILDKHHVEWTAIWEPIYDTTTPQGRLVVTQLLSIAQFEAENTGQRIRQVQSYKVSQGEVISGSCPPGYRIEGKHLVPDENAEGIRQVFQHYATHGNLNETMRFSLQFSGMPKTKSAFKTMLTNTKYIGTFRDNPQFCPPLVDREVFETVQRSLCINIKSSQKECYIFSGLVVCESCGAKLGGGKRIYHRVKGDVTVHFYRCPRHYNGGIKRCDCARAIREPVLERYLLKEVSSLVTGKLEKIKSAEPPDNSRKIKSIERKIERLKDLYLEELITLDEYKSDKEKYEKEIEALGTPAEPVDVSHLESILDMDIPDLYKTFTQEEKRFFWRSFIRSITYSQGGFKVDFL